MAHLVSYRPLRLGFVFITSSKLLTMVTFAFLAALPWLQAHLLAWEVSGPRPMSCRIEAQMRALSLQQHLFDGGSLVRPIPTICSIKKRG